MSQNFLVSLLLKARDELSGPMVRAFQNLKRESQEASSVFQRLSQSSIRAAEQQAKGVEEASTAEARAVDSSLSKRLRDYQRFNQAYETLGLRTEAEIQREIRRTEAAYQRLAQSGAMSAEEQARAFARMTQTVAELNREMGKLSRTERALKTFQGGANGLRRIGDGVLGAVGAAHAVAEPVKETMAFDRRVAMMANTAFNERDVPGRLSGETEIRGAIKHTLNLVGGNLDRVTETLDNLLSHNTLSHDQVFRLLPVLQKYATAEGADPNELGNIAFRAIQNFGFKEEQIPKALDMAIRGGHMGGFKLPDMAKWLPQQMAAAKNSGMNGTEGLAALIALNELSVTTAGTVDEAGNNVMDLLTHLNSRDTARSVKKHLNRDLSVMLANGRAQGKNSVEVFGELLEQVAEKDKNYQLLKGKLANTKDDGQRREMLESMLDIVQGSAIGKIVHNRQELQALMAYVNQKDKYHQIKEQTLKAQGYGDTDFKVIEQSADYKTERAKSIADMGEKDALRGFSDKVGDAASKLADYGAQYPGLTSAVMGAKVAFEGVTQAIIAIGLGRMLFGQNAHGVGGEAAEASSGASAATGAAGGSLLARLRMGLGLGTLATAAANFTTDEEDDEVKNGDARWKQLRAQYPQPVIDAARKKYQPWYQFGDGYAAENERWIKQYLADQAAQRHNAIPPTSPIPQLPAVPPLAKRNEPGASAPLPQLAMMQSAVNASLKPYLEVERDRANRPPQPIVITNQIHLDGQVIAEQVNQINAQSALRH